MIFGHGCATDSDRLEKGFMRNRIEYAAVLAVRALVRALPRRTSLSVGTVLGRLFYVLHGRRRELAVANLRAAFPSRTERECREILLSTFVNFGRHVVDVLNFDAMSTAQMTSFIEIEGEERVEQAMAQGKGVICCAGHFGYWELHIMAHALWFRPLVVVARTLDNPLVDRLVERIRSRLGTRAIPRQGAVRGVLRALMHNEPVAMMIDQHMQDRSVVVVDFFNRPASTTSAVAALSLRTGAPIIPVFALPLPSGRYRMVYETPVELPAADDPHPIRTYTQRCTDVLEMYVRRYPDLWLWMHRRWRTDVADGNANTVVAPAPGDADVREDVRP